MNHVNRASLFLTGALMLLAVRPLSGTAGAGWLAAPAEAAAPAPFDELRERFRTSDTLYASVTLTEARVIGGEWIIRGRLGDSSSPPTVVAYGRSIGDQALWNGVTLLHSNLEEPSPTSLPDVENLVAAVFAEARAGFPTTTIGDATPVDAGIKVLLDERRPWVRLGFAHPELRGLDVYVSMTTVPWVAPYEVIVASGSVVLGRAGISVIEWNVVIDPTVFTAERPEAAPPLIPGVCMRPQGCGEPPPELLDRISPTGELISQLHPSRLAYHGVSPDGRGVVCHRPPGYPDHAFTILVELRDVKNHYAHGDAVGPCKGQQIADAREDPDDPEGKTTLCHVPPGDPAAAHTLQVADAAVPAHLGHGDYLGPCYPQAADAPEDEPGDEAPEEEPAEGSDGSGGSPPNSGGLACRGCASGRPLTGAPLALAMLLLVRRRRVTLPSP